MRFAALVLVCACVQSHEVPCDDGRLCPAGNTCDDANHRCLSPEQSAACAGRAEGDDCTLTGITGVCQGGICEPLICGDGIRTGTESCDGNDLGGATCKTAGFYEPDGLACTPFCTFDTSQCKAFCGDGIVQPEELCDGAPPRATCVDDGFDAGALQCNVRCGASFEGCARFGWHPESTGLEFLAALDGKGIDDLWVTGQHTGTGLVAHFDGTGWTTVAMVPGHPLGAVAEVSPDDVWLLDNVSSTPVIVHLLHGQAAIVSDAPAGRYEQLLALAANDVYVATSDAGVLHWNGASWQTVGALASATATCGFCAMAIAGTSATDLWVARTDGVLMHWDGMLWQQASLAVSVRQISEVSPTNVWVVGSSATSAGVVAHWDGAAWTTYAEGPVKQGLYAAVVARADNDVWIGIAGGAMLHFDGMEWTPTDSRMAPSGNGGGFTNLIAFRDQVIGATSDGFVARYTGQLVARYDTRIIGNADAIISRGPTDTWIGDGRGTISHYDGDSWKPSFVGPPNEAYRGFFATATNELFAWTTRGTTYRLTGATWTLVPEIVFGGRAVWAATPTDIWFFDTSISHFDGVTMTSVLTPTAGTAFTSASGRSTTDIWAATDAGAVYHWDGTTWTLVYSAPAGIDGIVAVPGGDVVAVATDRRAYQLHDGTWQATAIGSLNPLKNLSATAPDDVFASSSDEIFHFDGTRWNPLRRPSDPVLGADPLRALDAHPGFVDLLYQDQFGSQQVRRLIRTRPWNCAATETACGDGVDNDCDGLVDGNDPDCP